MPERGDSTSNSSSESSVKSEAMLGDCTRGDANSAPAECGAGTYSGLLLRASTEWMSEKGDWTREPGFRSGSVYADAGPTSETSDPPRGVLYEDGTASEALRLGSGRAGDRGEPSDAVVVGVIERDDGRE